MKKELLFLCLVSIVRTTLPKIAPASQILLIQNSKDVKEVRYLKSGSNIMDKLKSGDRKKSDVEHPYCRMSTKLIFARPDVDFIEDGGVQVIDQRFTQLCKGLTATCCSLKELKSLMDTTKRRVIDTLADLLIDFSTLHRTLMSYNHLLVQIYAEKRPERVKKCTGKDPNHFMNFYDDVIAMMSELEEDGVSFKIVTLLNEYYRFLSVQAYEDNCRLCNPIENRFLFFNDQFLKYEIEFGFREMFVQYYNRTFYNQNILKLILFAQSIECITSYNTDYINIDKIFELERKTANLIINNEIPQQITAIENGFLEFMSFNPFSIQLIRFYTINKMFISITKSISGEYVEFFEQYPAFEVQQKNYYPEFSKKNSIFNYNRDYGFYTSHSIAFNADADTEYVHALSVFKNTTLYAITLVVVLKLTLF